MTTTQTDRQLNPVDEPTEPQPNPPGAAPGDGRLCRWCVLESVLSIVVWVAIAVAITKLIDWYGWSSWWLIAVAIACLVAAYLMVDLGYAVAAARRAFAEPPSGGDR